MHYDYEVLPLMINQQQQPLDKPGLEKACQWLARGDEDLNRIYDQLGTPPMWARKPGYETLVHIILEQQVSLASAQAMFLRVKEVIRPLTPVNLLTFSENKLRALGVTRQKARYFLLAAQAIQTGELELDSLQGLTDEEAIAHMVRITGIGPWTAQIYLLNALRRPDVWPSGDIALASAARHLKKLPSRPKPDELRGLAKAWRPHRATAARMLWQYYLSGMKGS
jgi:DNA-3-methyladenine glycosylase II